MKFKMNIVLFLIFMSFVINSSGQTLQNEERERLDIKLENTISFNDDKINRVFTRANTQGNLAISPNLEYFIGSIGKSDLYIRNLKSDKITKVSVSHNISYAIFSSDSKKVAVFDDVIGNRKIVTILNLESGKILSVVNSPEKIDQVGMSPDGKWIATSRVVEKLLSKGKSTVRLWDASNGSLIAEIKGCGSNRRLPEFSSDSQWLLLDCEKIKNKPVKLINAKTGEEIFSMEQNNQYAAPESVFSPDAETIVSVYRFIGIRLWDASSGNLKKEFIASQGHVISITFTKDGESFVTNGFSPVIRLWNTQSGQLLQTFKSNITKSPAFMITAKISPSGETLVGIDNRGRISVWNTETGKVKFNLNETAEKQDLSVNVFFGLGGRVLYIRGEKSLRLVNSQTGETYTELPNPTGDYYISNDGKRIFTQNADNISVWNVN